MAQSLRDRVEDLRFANGIAPRGFRGEVGGERTCLTLVEPSSDGAGARDGDLEVLVRTSASRVIADDYEAAPFLAALAAAGVVAPEPVLAVLSSIACTLGDLWLEDSCTFNDVTIGMHRLTLLLIGMEPSGVDPFARPQHGGRIFLSPAPGDQHGFGLAMVGYCLRRGGWDVSAELDAEEERIVAHVARGDYHCVGFSVGHERAIEAVARLIRRVRLASRRIGLTILVGGPMIVANPALAEEMGADLWAPDGPGLVARLATKIPCIAA